MRTQVLLASLTLSLGACTSGRQRNAYWDPAGGNYVSLGVRLAALRTLDPVRDAQRAVARRDYHLLGMMAPVLVVPGVDQPGQQCAEPNVVRLIVGASDYSADALEEAYNRAAGAYAVRYNKTVLKVPT